MKEMIEEIMKAVSETDYEYYGIRVDNGKNYCIGDRTDDSRIWIDGDPTDETVDGTSCVGFRFNAEKNDLESALSIAEKYYGDRIYLIGSNSMEYGEDAGEYILKDAEVIAVLM